ncbi:hypothetical protein ACWNT8_09190 [Pigmentibacter ruber]|uniref:hypothetical protein n=1 Tax=Pigmentibacter ruber TaxID=2683196 RepID=UPI00131C8EA5|nr:hypothetical protein [Pigmentibacter ruber]BFD32540.1 hypothetical protein GTC16762_21580 [Pigmentibacter ruber]
MNFCFNLDEISSLITKAELGFLTPNEHSYLQKMIAAQTVINQFTKNFNEQVLQYNKLISKYYKWVCFSFEKKNINKKDLTELFLLKNSLEKIYYNEKNKIIDTEKPLSFFGKLNELAKIWNYNLEKNEKSIINFLKIFMNEMYYIPEYLVENIMQLVVDNWRPILFPIGPIFARKFSLKEIEEYFFGENSKPDYQTHIIERIDRFFSLVGVGHTNHIFLSKKNDFELYEASLIVHELQHIVDAKQHKILPEGMYLADHLFLAEKNALNAERIFLNGNGVSKKGKYNWLEANLFYPLLLLKCEFHSYLNNEINISNFKSLCLSHGMDPVNLSTLFDWGAPFQMSIYCAAVLELEQNWKKYIQ